MWLVLNYNLNDGPSVLINTLTCKGKRTLTFLKRQSVRHNLLLSTLQLTTTQQGNGSRVSIPIISEDADDIDLTQGRCTNGQSLDGITHTNLHKDTARGGGVDAGLHASGDTGAFIHTAEARDGRDAIRLRSLGKRRSDILGILERPGCLVSVRGVLGRGRVCGITAGDEECLQAEAEGGCDFEARGVDVGYNDGIEILGDCERGGDEQADGAGATD